MGPLPAQRPTTRTAVLTGSGTFRSREPPAGRAALSFIPHAPHRERMLGAGPKLVLRTPRAQADPLKATSGDDSRGY